MDKSDAFRLEHERKVAFFDYHRRFRPLNNHFRSDKRSFLQGKASQLEKSHQSENLEQISQKYSMALRSLKMVSSNVTVKSTTRLIKVVFGNSLMQRH
jgi:hypothetical protein